jgi:hypothetical protein
MREVYEYSVREIANKFNPEQGGIFGQSGLPEKTW